jgi:hypothetical protein
LRAVQKPDWKQYAPTLASLAVSAGAVLGTAAVHFNTQLQSNPADSNTLLVAVGTNLVASGIAALCKPGVLKAKAEFQETLANHDIRRLVETAWGEAAKAALDAYLEARQDPFSITNAAVSDAFRAAVKGIEPSSFLPAKGVSVGEIRSAIESSRRHLLTGPDPADRKREEEVAAELKEALVQSMLTAISAYLHGSEATLPADLEEFLRGDDSAYPGGVLGELLLHAALYLKTNPHAQTAILHLTLQEIVDKQDTIQKLCEQIKASLSDTDQVRLGAFEQRMEAQTAAIQAHIDRAFNNHSAPRLDAPFDEVAAEFTYRERRTPLIGREAALQSLLAFMGDPRPGLWTIISGPAGTGKSRLAAEVVARVRDYAGQSPEQRVLPGQWRAGFLQFGAAFLSDDLRKWTPDADTLIVIDYAGELDANLVAALLARLGEESQEGRAGRPGFQLRVILIERLAPDSEFSVVRKALTGDRRGKIAECRWDSATASEDGGTAPSRDVLALKPLAEHNALEVVRAWVEKAGKTLTPPVEQRVREAVEGDHELARPLFAALLGDAIATDGLPPGELNPVSVANAALLRLFGDQHENEKVWKPAKAVLALATAGQGVEWDAASDEQTLRDLGLAPSAVDGDDLRLRLARVSGIQKAKVLPMEPDFLGGLFVLQWLLQGASPKQSLARAETLMKLAWQHGSGTGAFLVRLTGDFVARMEQVAKLANTDDFPVDAQRVSELLIRLITNGLMEPTNPFASYTVSQCVYVASKAGQVEFAKRLLEQMQAVYSTNSNLPPDQLARAWFAFAMSGDLPSSARAYSLDAQAQLEILWAQHQTEGTASWFAQALMNAAIAEGANSKRCEALADRIATEIRTVHDTPEIALLQAIALVNAAAAHDANSQRREALADRIAKEIRIVHDSLEIALEQAKALFNAAAAPDADSQRCEDLADRIAQEIRTVHDRPEIALAQAIALFGATAAQDADSQRCEALADRIAKEIRTVHDTPEIALRQAKALLNAAAAPDGDSQRREDLADRIAQEIRTVHDTPEIALELAKALFGAAAAPNADSQRSEALADRIAKEIRTVHDTPEIALRQAMALVIAADAQDTNSQRSEALADRITKEIRAVHDTAEIALRQAMALVNAAAAQDADSQRCEELADRIAKEIRTVNDTPEIALRQARALVNAALKNPDEGYRAALTLRIEQILDSHQLSWDLLL